jgi:hypothetical protein
MSEEDLELLVTLDDPVDVHEEDTFNHLQVGNTLEYWLSQRFLAFHQHQGITIREWRFTRSWLTNISSG